jgi:STE24 endopeptidase
LQTSDLQKEWCTIVDYTDARTRFGLITFLVSLSVTLVMMWTRALGIQHPSPYTALIAFYLALSSVLFFFAPVSSWNSRKHEYEADAFAANALGTHRHLAEALVSLTESNASNIEVHPLFTAFNDSHPGLMNRISAMKRRPRD